MTVISDAQHALLIFRRVNGTTSTKHWEMFLVGQGCFDSNC